MTTILCNSKSALEMIQNPSNKSGQQIIHAVLQATTEIQAREIALSVNGYQDIVTTQGMVQRIDWPKTPQDQARHTTFLLCSQGRRHSSTIASPHSGSKSGSLLQKGVTFEN